MHYIVADIGTREPHPDSPTFTYASSAAAWIVAKELPPVWWPIPLDTDPQPARLEGTP